MPKSSAICLNEFKYQEVLAIIQNEYLPKSTEEQIADEFGASKTAKRTLLNELSQPFAKQVINT